MNRKKGFTLIEIMIIVAVIMLLAALTINSYRRIRLNANESAATNHLRIIANGLLMYHTNNNPHTYPENLSSLGSSVIALAYIDSVLASGEKQGYGFNYSRVDSESYQLNADPLFPGKSGERYFYMDETGVIRFSRAGTADDDDEAIQ